VIVVKATQNDLISDDSIVIGYMHECLIGYISLLGADFVVFVSYTSNDKDFLEL